MSNRHFTATEAALVVGLPYRTLDHWARTGVICPSEAEAHGKGSERSYSFTDIVLLSVGCDLRSVGISMKTLRAVVDALRTEFHGNPVSGMRFVVIGSDVTVARNCGQAAALLRTNATPAFAYVFNFTRKAAAVKHLAEQILAPFPARAC
jgi:DNA-binding transcriptional MerR regulator